MQLTMNSITINTYVILSPNELDKNLDSIIMEKLNAKYANKCIKKYGYILEVEEFKHDSNIIVSRVNQDMYVKCSVKILSIIPEVNQVYYGIVKIVYPQGIFIRLLNIFDTLIPYEVLNKKNYKFVAGSFVHQVDGTVISTGSFVNVKIVDMNYNKKNFNCIAELVDIDDIAAPDDNVTTITLKDDNDEEEEDTTITLKDDEEDDITIGA